MNDDSERLMSKCGTINEIHKTAEENPTLKVDLNASLQAPINLIHSMFDRQFLKDEPFKTFTAASETEMERLWETMQLVDDSITNKAAARNYFRIPKLISGPEIFPKLFRNAEIFPKFRLVRYQLRRASW